MTEEEIKIKYAAVLSQAKVMTVIFAALMAPRLILGFTDLESFLGLNYVTALIPMAIGSTVYGIFAYKFWKCPSCGSFPGGGWSRAVCKKCGVELK